MANRHRVKLKFEDIIAKGDLHPGVADGFQAQTANGTAEWMGTGWNIDYASLYPRPQLPTDPTRPPGRSNRTGE